MIKKIIFLMLCLSIFSFNANAQSIKDILMAMPPENDTSTVSIFMHLQEIKAYLSGATNIQLVDSDLELIKDHIQKMKDQFALINEEFQKEATESEGNNYSSQAKELGEKIPQVFEQVDFALQDNSSYKNTYKRFTYDELETDRSLKLASRPLTQYECQYVQVEYGLESFRQIFRDKFISVNSVCVN